MEAGLHPAGRLGGYVKLARCAAVGIAAGLLLSGPARGDEGGVSFWAPGLLGSLAAVPTTPGLSFALVYYHAKASADPDKSFPRGGRIVLGLDAKVDVFFFGPAYTLAPPVLGGQLALSLTALAGRSAASVTATATGPLGNKFASLDDSRWGFGDLYPQVTLKWNLGAHNVMAYLTGDIPVGAYDPNRLANLGIGHGAIDWGFGYTYLNPATGHEFSAVGGFTYNFTNTDTQYKNGVDFHLDWGASQFLTKQLLVGLVGYVYQELGCDSGSGDRVGCFKSRVIGIGPQAGFILPLGKDWQGYF